jgi:hypothetical protein
MQKTSANRWEQFKHSCEDFFELLEHCKRNL